MSVLTTNRKLKEIVRFIVMLYFNNFSNFRYLFFFFFKKEILGICGLTFSYYTFLFFLFFFYIYLVRVGVLVLRESCMKQVTNIVGTNLFKDANEKMRPSVTKLKLVPTKTYLRFSHSSKL